MIGFMPVVVGVKLIGVAVSVSGTLSIHALQAGSGMCRAASIWSKTYAWVVSVGTVM